MKIFRADEVVEAEVVKEKVVRCAACGTRNRVFIIRGKSNLCGKCKAPLHPFPALNGSSAPSWCYNRVLKLAGAVVVGFLVVCFVVIHHLSSEEHPQPQFDLSLSIPVATEQVPANPRHLPNGTVLKDFDYPGQGTLTIDNGTSRDAVVKLVGIGAVKASFEVYIGAGRSVNVPQVLDGFYEVYFALGIDWDDTIFGYEKSFGKFDNIVTFKTTEYNYSTISMTLHTVAHGNARTSTVTQREFERF
jgi:hypothetical protein